MNHYLMLTLTLTVEMKLDFFFWFWSNRLNLAWASSLEASLLQAPVFCPHLDIEVI